MDVLTILVGASIVAKLKEIVPQDIKIAAVSGLSYSSPKKFLELKRQFQSYSKGVKKLNILFTPLLNSIFAGLKWKDHYLKPSKKGLSIRKMAKQTFEFIDKLKSLCDTDAEVSVYILPSFGRRRKGCQRGCDQCQKIRFQTVLSKLHLELTKLCYDNINIIQFRQWAEFYQKNFATRKYKRKLPFLLKRLITGKIGNPSYDAIIVRILSTISTNCPGCFRARKCRKRGYTPANVVFYRRDMIHCCCNFSAGQYASFILKFTNPSHSLMLSRRYNSDPRRTRNFDKITASVDKSV